VGSAVSRSGPAGCGFPWRAGGLVVELRDGVVPVAGAAAGGCAVSSVGGVAGLGAVGDDVGVGDVVAQAATLTPASATVRAKNRSRSMRMRYGLARSAATLVILSTHRPVVRVCAAIVRDGAILMVRHEHDGRAYWTLPGGGVEHGETPEQALVREVREEACVEVCVGRRLFEESLGERGVDVCFAATIDPHAQPRLGCDPELASDAQVLTAVAWLPLDEVADDIQVSRVIAASARL
jgi:8-oxo-dGTP diphosphatase